MKIARFLAACLFLAPGLAFAQMEGVATFKVMMHATDKGDGSTTPQGSLKIGFSKNAARMDMGMDVASMGARKPGNGDHAQEKFTMTTIVKFAEPDKVYMLNDAQKSYSVMDVSKMREQSARPTETWTVKRLGKDTVAGMSCEKAVVTSSGGSSIEMCVSTDIAVSSAWWAAMNRRQGGNSLWVKTMGDAGLKGLPVRMRYLSPQGTETVQMELVSFERHALPASAFEIPVGYKETNMAGAMGMTAEQQKAMNDAIAKMTPEQRKAYEDAMKKSQGNH